MKKVNMETNFNTIKEMAKQLGLKFVGVKKEVLVQQINEATEVQSKKAGKWYEQENAFPYNEGDLIIIIDNKHKGIVGKMAQVVKPSSKKNAVKAYIINEKNGGLQKTMVTLDFDGIELYNQQLPAIIPSRVIA